MVSRTPKSVSGYRQDDKEKGIKDVRESVDRRPEVLVLAEKPHYEVLIIAGDPSADRGPG